VNAQNKAEGISETEFHPWKVCHETKLKDYVKLNFSHEKGKVIHVTGRGGP
jgi:hypothetical protein